MQATSIMHDMCGVQAKIRNNLAACGCNENGPFASPPQEQPTDGARGYATQRSYVLNIAQHTQPCLKNRPWNVTAFVPAFAYRYDNQKSA